ncbi:MAG: MotA/TolQ/ExbB proton channel family protein, partial [Deltaproteobacteria bacterium]|nr:MotA/TolQ/ExbB proton channel family protein [Deltaproteobacteria bacterium]
MPQWFIEGGPVMWPLLLCSIAALAIFLEKLYSLRREKIIPRSLLSTINSLISDKKISEVKLACQQNQSTLATVLHAGVSLHGKKRDRVKENIEEVGKKEVLNLSRNIGALATIAHISPLLGLLGTVTGMFRVFQVITSQGVGNAQSLAGGIAEALITTIAGLVIAIPTVVAYRYLTAKV